VTLNGARETKDYADAYFDNLAATATAPGAPPPPGDPRPGAPRPRRFAGIRVLTRVAPVRRGAAVLRLACASATVGGCAGVVTLAGAPRRRTPAHPHGRTQVAVAPGRRSRVRLPLDDAVRGVLWGRRRMGMTVFTAVRDGQGSTRVATVPVTLRP